MANEITAVSASPPLFGAVSAERSTSTGSTSSGGVSSPAPVPVLGSRSTSAANDDTVSIGGKPAGGTKTALEDVIKSSEESVQRALDEIAKHFEGNAANLQFRMDRDAGRMVLSIVDAKDGTVIKQLPSEVTLRIARGIDSFREHLHLVEEIA